mgnify:CR=1 FL=1
MNENRFFSPDLTIRSIAHQLYNSSKNLPIFSPHGHVDPSLFSNPDASFGNPVDLFIKPDHYILRMLYTNGLSLEEFGVSPRGKSIKIDKRKIWQLFGEKFYLFRGTPSGIWLSTSFKDVFGIEKKLSKETANFVYDRLVEKLTSTEFSPRKLYERFNIEFLATTDSPADSLKHHQIIQGSNWKATIVPTFRFDSLVHLQNPIWFDEIQRLALLSNTDIKDFKSFIRAIEVRRKDFKSLGATATDFSAETAVAQDMSPNEVEMVFQRALQGKADQEDADRFVAHMLMEMARMSTEDGLVMQFHAGIYRNHNRVLYEKFGSDIGGDIPLSVEFTKSLLPLLQKFGNEKKFQLILFTLDEATYTRELAPLAGHYPAVKLGAPWWFNDSINGITRYLNQVIETAGLYKTAGFNDDTRGFCSIPARHDLWRRMAANWLAELLVRHIIDEEDAHQMMFDLVVGLAHKAYKWEMG